MMKKALLLAGLAAGMACVLLAPRAAAQRILPLPPEFAAYRTWKPLIRGAFEVPPDRWILWAAPGEAAAASHEPAGKRRTIQVYANPAAEKVLKSGKSRGFPVGAILAKEKMTGGGAGGPAEFAGIGFMIKRSADRFQDTGNWEFLYFPSGDGEKDAIQASCSSCHKTAAGDFVFADYLAGKH